MEQIVRYVISVCVCRHSHSCNFCHALPSTLWQTDASFDYFKRLL